jgi:hypothetical protein
MAFGRNTTVEQIKPLNGSVIRRFTAGATIVPGEIVAMMADGYVDPANTTDFTAAVVVGIALPPASGGSSIGAGERVDVVTGGPVVCLLEATPGALIYASDTAGEPSTSVGTKDVLVGFAESATVLFVRPEFIDRS